MRRNNTMRKKIMAFALLITMLCNNSAVSAWAAAEEETQVVSSSENNEPSVDLPDAQEQQTEAGETMTGTESTDSDREQTEAADQGTDSSTDQSEAPQEDIPEVSPEEVIEIEDYIREEFGEEYVPLMNEKLEGDEIPGYEDLEAPNGSDNQFVVDLALSANEHWWQNQDSFDSFKDNGYEYDGVDINSGSGMSSKYIYLGWKYTNDIQANIGSVITGILIKIGKRVDYFEYNNKKYYPLSRQFRDSNFDLNQGAGGDYLYIYYTRDGAEKGDPVISTDRFGISTGRPSSGLLADGIDDNGSITKDMDINPKGNSTYLTYTYHYHNLVAVPKEDGHTFQCTSCNFHKTIEPHEYEYVSINDSQHEGTCKVCKHKIQAPHMDTDYDLKCDVCQTPVEVYIAIPGSPKPKQTGAYKTFTAAWNDAVAKKTDCYINLLKDISLTNSNIAQGAQHLTPMENGKTITIQTHVDEKKETEPKPKAKLTVDGNNFQNLSEVFYVRNGELIIDTNITIDGGVSFNSFMTASSSAARIKIDHVTVHVNGRLNKDLSVITADQSALLEVPGVNLEFTGSRGSKPYSIYGIHVMNGSTADIALATINDYDQAFRVNNAKLNIHEGHYQNKNVVAVERGEDSEILIQGGEFIATDGYCLDSNGAKVTVEVGKFTGNIRVGEHQKIGSVLAPGRCVAEIDASDHITKYIPYKELEAAGNIITFAKRTMILECKNHYASEGVYYSRKTHTGICVYCRQKELFPHEFNEKGSCIQCGVDELIVLITNAGIAEYYNSLEDAVKAIRERTGVTLKLRSSIEATDPFKEESSHSRRDVVLDLSEGTLILNNKENSAQVIKNFNLKIVNGKCTVPASDFLIENAKLILGEDATLNIMKGGLKFGTASDLTLQKNAKLGLYDELNIADGCSLTMTDQASLDFRKDVHIGLHVLEGASLYVSGEASVNLNNTLDSPHTIVIDAGATARFTGGIINSEEGNAIEIREKSEYKDLRYLLEPGYAYYIKSGTDWVLTNYAFVDRYSVLRPGQYMIKPHDEHVYNRYEDLKDGTHRSYCSVCRVTGEISRHSSKNGSHHCQFCKAEYSCSHEFVDPGICKTCGLEARVCVTIDDKNFYYLSMNDAWDYAKGKKAIIRPLFKYGEDIERVIEDKDDITIEYPEHTISTSRDLFTVNGGKLTISEGHFDTRFSSYMAVVVNDGELIINGGKIESKLAINGGKVTINNATINKDVNVYGGEVVINDGDFQGIPPIHVEGGNLTIKGGDFYAPFGGPALSVHGGHVTLQGGQFRRYRDHAGVLNSGGLVTALLTPGYYYAEPGTNTPAKIDPKTPDIVIGDVTVNLHEDHTGYWKGGVCSLCKYECTHPSFEGNRCTVCGVEIKSQLFVVYKEGDDSKRENFDHLQDALNFASQHPGSELIVSKDIPAAATDKTSYIVPDEGLSVDSPIDFTIQLGKHTIGTKLFIKKSKVTIKGDGGGISVSSGSALYIGMDANVYVENCNFHTDDSKLAAISIKDSKTAYLKNVHANGGYAVDASDVKDTVTLDGGYYCTASGDEDSSLQAVAFTGTSGTIKGCTITATAEDAAALYLYRCAHVVIDNTRLLIDDTAKGANSIRIPSRGSSETELVIGDGSEIYEMTSGKNITDDHSEEGRISESVDKSIYIGKVFPEKQAQIIGYEPLTDIEFPAGTAIDDIIAKIPTEANAVTLNYPDKKVKVKVAFDKEEIRKAIQKVYDQEIKTLTRGENRVRTKKIDIYAKGIVSGWPEDISVVLEDTLNLRLCVEVRKYSVTLNDGQTKQEYFTGDTVELHMDGHTHGKVFSHWDVIEGDVNLDISLPENSFIMPSDNLVINAVYEEQLELIPEKTATCTEPGNKAYYICDCGQWFWSPEDAKADKPIEDHNKVLIPAAGHIDKDMDDRCDICCEKLTHKDNEGEVNNRTNGKTEGSNNSGVFTGDQSDLLTWLILLVGSSLGLYVLIRRRRYH